ncbi:PREDICTED: uncharacterized protein LOC109327740 [Lupinus angustifolius]|uniref:uncharacterized protein LOC109327740 n=1 Tax=Lupinus angustifolius TaxID=3871 RepID=UPI00092E79B8|nr:PREDICTED: uncharacterized protein LOC109327740 [Lupinus angustifolius]
MVTTFIYNHIWTVNLMEKYTGGKEIVRPGITRFATKFLQLQAIVNQKQGLKQMFNSEEFRKSKFYKQKNETALEARKIVLDHEFWSRTSDILKVFEPIVKVLRLVDGDTKPTMGYFLNPQFQYGVEHGTDVYKKTFDETSSVIMKLERDMDKQIKAFNQLLLYRNKSETFGTPQAQAAWSKMNPDEWWMIFGSCSPELKNIAIKVHNQKLQPRILKMRTEMRRSQEEIEASFNPINLDNIFQEDDPLSKWIEERVNPALDGAQNAEWLPIIDTDDENENMEVDSDDVGSDEYSGGLSHQVRMVAMPLESGQVPSHQSSLMNYQEPYYQQSSHGFFDYVFGQGPTQDDSQYDNEDYAPQHHSSMW